MTKTFITLIVLAAASLAACEMSPAEVLAEPRLLALQTEPAALAPGEPMELAALTFDVSGEVAWSACPVAWAPTDPLTCPSGDALDLGRGNPLTVTAPTGVESLWLRAEAGDALPAVKLVEATSAATNPTLSGLDAPATLAAGAALEVMPRFGEGSDAAAIVVSWYVTGGTLEPRRTVGLEPATLTAPSAPGPLTIIAVARTKAGGTAWTQSTLTVTP
ncbi:MAG: hypothetical protein U1F43_22640 [Myxococcota bacterium]